VPPNGAFGNDFNEDLAGLADLASFLVLADALMAAAFRQWFKLTQIES
jgi:hypothetical protein